MRRIKTDRSLLMYILLSIVTCGIYSYWFVYTVAQDLNEICKEDGEKTGGLAAFVLLSIVTFGIYSYYWYYKLANRIAANAPKYGISIQENGTTILMWIIFGTLICGIGSYVAMHIIIKNVNALAIAYNEKHGL